MADFRTALRLDPTNAELTKLLSNAIAKQREVDGAPLAERQAPTIPATLIPTECVTTLLQARLPADIFSFSLVGNGRILDTTSASLATPPGEFVRIPVSFDGSDSDSDVEEANSSQLVQTTPLDGFQRIAITEDDDAECDQSTSDVSVEDRANKLKEAGNDFLTNGNVLEALEAYNQCLELLPQSIPALGNRAQAYLLLKVGLIC